MEITDANRLRVQAMDLLIDTLGKSTQLGAVEFGSGLFETPGADTLFPPEPVGPNAAAMRISLDEKIHADNGATDYNAAPSPSPTSTTRAPPRGSSSPMAATTSIPTTKPTSPTTCRPM